MAIVRPRKARIRCSGAPTSSSPSSRIEPATMRPGASTRPRMEQAVTDLPDPDSPTRPRTSPPATAALTPSTALMTPARVKKCVRRFSMASTGAGMALAFEARIHHVLQLIADEIDCENHEQQSKPGIERNPVISREHVAVAVGDQQAKRRLGDRHAHAEERQCGFERNGMGDLDSRDDDQRRKCIRQKMAEHDARVRECEPARGINIL